MRRLALIAALVGCAPDPGLQSRPVHLPDGAAVHADVLAGLDADIASALTRADAAPGSWLPLQTAAARYQSRARLTGSLDDYAAAEGLLADAFAIADPSGPFLSRAGLNFSLHRFDAVEGDLATVERRVFVDDPTRAAVAGLRGDVLLQQGDVDLAFASMEAAEELHADMTSVARLALHARRTGELDRADALYEEAAGRYHGDSPEVKAWLHLQRGLVDLDRQRYEDALEHYRDANAELSGFYLVEEHIAEAYALTGRREEALGLYEDIIARTGHPEFIDAAARLHRDHGDPADAAPLVAAADAAYRQQLDRFPEAAYGHAVGHYIEFGPPDVAIDLALRNHTVRPNGEAKALVAEAYLAAGDDAAAAPWIEAARSSGWWTPRIAALPW